MNRKFSLILTITLLVSLLIATPVLAAKSYYAERFDVQVDLQEDGSALITETVEFHFEGDPFTFAFREVSAARTDGLTFLEASMDGVRMPQGTQPGQVEVEAGDPLKVTWHFPPTADAVHIFVLRYRADGVIRTGETDVLLWRAIPEEHEYPIARSTVALTFPSTATLVEQPFLNREFERTSADGSFTLTSVNGLAEDQDLVLGATFNSGSLTTVMPEWQIRQEQRDAAAARALPAAFWAGLVTLILGTLGLLTYIRSNARDLAISPVVPTPNPPGDVPPALIAKLAGLPHGFMGAIFDLAQRGVVEVQEEPGFLGSTNHVLVLKESKASLKPHEQGLLEAIFKPGEAQAKMNEIATRLAANNKLFDEPLEEELTQRGWFDPQRKQKRSRLMVAGLLMMFLAIALFIAGLVMGLSSSANIPVAILFAIMAGIGAGMFLLSLALLIHASSFSILTPLGEEQLVRWKGFGEYLKQVSKGKEAAIRPDYFERYLAYAAVFGLGTRWAKYFQHMGGVPLPIWFHASVDNANFGAMVAMMSASDSAGASAAAGGGGGASGGGSSGAG